MSLEVELSRFVAELEWDDLPALVQDRVLDIWADTVANALAGRRAATTPVVQQLAAQLCGSGDATVIGGLPLSPTGAAFLNGHQITAFTMCDVYRPALCHITPEVVPAVLGAAEMALTSGREILTGVAIGLEVTSRLGQGVDYPRFRQRGWHSPGTIGTIGAACAAARVLGLNDRGIRAAMGLGASQASGTFAALGTPAVKFHQARGAVSALWAALFTVDGLGGTEQALTHPDGGLLAAYCDGGAPERVTADLGVHWELMEVSLRRWPAASSLQSLVGALLDGPEFAVERVDGVEISLPPTPFAMCAQMGWDDELTAMQSARYVASVVLHDRQCWIEQFGAARRGDRVIGEFASDIVTVVCDDTLAPTEVVVRIRQDGELTTLRRGNAPGEPGEPLTREQIGAKLDSASRTALGAVGLGDIVFGAGERSAAEVCQALAAGASTERSSRDYASRS